MKHAKQEIKEAIKSTGAFMSEKKGEEFSALSQKTLKDSSSIKDILAVSDDSMEGVYGQAYLLYNTGRYRDAAEIFSLLITLNATESKYLMGLGACYHMMKEYNNAGSTYALVSVIVPDNPVPYFHSSDCCMQMGDLTSSAIMLEMALKRAANKPEFATLKERSQITLNALKSKLLQGSSVS